MLNGNSKEIKNGLATVKVVGAEIPKPLFWENENASATHEVMVSGTVASMDSCPLELYIINLIIIHSTYADSTYSVSFTRNCQVSGKNVRVRGGSGSVGEGLVTNSLSSKMDTETKILSVNK